MAKYATSETTRAALICAAGELAAEFGFPNVSTRAIANRAKANVASIHYHFGSRDGLFEAVLRTVLEAFQQYPIRNLFDPIRDELDTPLGQAKAIRLIIERNKHLLFDRGQPRWYCRVLYQLMQYESPLLEIFRDEFLLPLEEVFNDLLLRINPNLSDEELHLINAYTFAPLSLHADYIGVITDLMGVEQYSEEYLDKLAEISIRQTQNLLGLPPDNDTPILTQAKQGNRR